MDADNPDTLFKRLLGCDYASLPAPVRRLHDAPDGTVFTGTGSVKRGNWLTALPGYFASLPAACDVAPLSVTIHKSGEREIWQRNFGGDHMRSSLCEQEGTLSERLGLVHFRFRLTAGEDAIHWAVNAVSVFGVPLPVAWFSGVTAREYASAGRYCFVVRATLPLLGRLIEYRGELVVDRGA